MKTSLLQLERSYVEAITEFGEHSQKAQETRIKLIEMLNQTGRYLLFQKLNGEKYLQRAIELTKMLNMEEQLMVKYQTYMYYAEYLESKKNYSMAQNLLIQLIPLAKTNERNIIMIQIQILNHIIENGRMCNKNNIIQFNEQLLNLMEEIGLSFYLYKEFPNKFQIILLQALSFQAKIYLKQNKDKEATQLFFQSFHLSEELLGFNDKKTQEYKKQYELLSDKISVNLEIQSQEEEEEDKRQKIQNSQKKEEKNILSFRGKNTYINNYIINVDSARAPKLAKKIDKNKIEKPIISQRAPPKFNEQQLQQLFVLKSQIKRPLSSQGASKMTSPTRCYSIFSKNNMDKMQNRTPSVEQSLIKQLETAQPKDRFNDLIINRPQYEEVRKYEIFKATQQRKSKQIASNYVIQFIPPSHSSRPQIREPSKTNILYKVDSKKFPSNPSNQNIERCSQRKIGTNDIQPTQSNIRLGSKINLTNEIDEENIKQQEDDRNYSFEEDPNKALTHSDPIIAKFLEKHPIEVLVEAVDRIKAKMKYHIYYSRMQRNDVQSNQNEIQPIKLHPHTKHLTRSNTYGLEILDIVEKKILENEASKVINKLISPANQLDWYPIHFYNKLFTDNETSKWDKEATQLFFQSFHLSEELLGFNDKKTQEYKKQYELLSDKISVNLEIQSQEEEEEDKRQKIQNSQKKEEKNILSFRGKNTYINNYIINVDSARAPKLAKKIDKNKIEKPIISQRAPPKFNEQQLQQLFVLKSQIKRPLSSQGASKMTSPTRCYSIFSKNNMDKMQNRTPSVEQSLIKQLETAQPKDRFNDLIINRPQYEEVRKYEIFKATQQRKSKQIASNYVIQFIPPSHSSRPQIREPSKTNILYKVDSKKFPSNPSNQNIERCSQRKIGTNDIQPTQSNIRLGSKINLTNEIDEENIKQQEDDRNYSFEEDPNKALTHSDPIIAKFLEKHPIEVLVEAVDRIKAKMKYHIYYSRMQRNDVQSNQNEIQPIKLHPHTKHLTRSNTYGLEILDIVEKKILENEASKVINKLISPANQLDWYPIHFYNKLFTDNETSKWVLQNPKITVQILQKSQNRQQYQQISVDLFYAILSNQKKSTTIQLIASIELSNHIRKFQVRFIIDSLADHYKEISSYEDMMDLFNQLTKIYFIQEHLLHEWKEENRQYTLYVVNQKQIQDSTFKRFSENQNESQKIDYYSDLLSKVLFYVRRKSYVKTINGFKFKSETQELQESIKKYNNEIYQQKIQRMKSYFQYRDLNFTCKVQESKKQLAISYRKQMQDNRLIIHEDTEYSLLNDSKTQQVYQKEDEFQQKSRINNDLVKDYEKLSRQNSSETPYSYSKFRPQSTKQNGGISQLQFETYAELNEIFSFETQDYLQRYFTEFKLNVPPINYYPTSSNLKQKQYIQSHYYFREEYLGVKWKKLSYKPIHSDNYLIQTQIVKLDKQFYFLTLTNKLKLEQILCKDKWEDELDIQLKELINYSVGRTGYIIDIIKLQERLQQKLEINHCKIQLNQEESDDLLTKKNLKLFRQNNKLYYVREANQFIEDGLKEISQDSVNIEDECVDHMSLQKRDPLIDIIFLIGILHNNSYVKYDAHLKNCELLKYIDGKLMFAEPEQIRKPKFPIRLILSHEDMNKHIARMNENTISSKDILLFPHFNSLFLFKQTQFNYKGISMKLEIQSDFNKLHQDIRNYSAKARLFIYKNNDRKHVVYLNSQQTERWLHNFQIDGRMQAILFSYRTMMKKTLTGRKLQKNENRQSLSKDIRFQLIQDKLVNTKQYFIQSKIQDVGYAFVTGIVFQNLLLVKVMPIGNKTKVHIFLYAILDCDDVIKLLNQLCKHFILKQTYTYSKLYLVPITQNLIRKQYVLGNQYGDNHFLIGEKSYSRVIFKWVKKIDRNYFIITVTLLKNYFQIYFYNSGNCRKFYYTIHRSDFLIMNQYFLDSIFPEQPKEIMAQLFRNWRFKEISNIHSLIIKAPETFKNRTEQYIQQIKDTKKYFKRSATSSMQSVNNLMRSSTLQLNNMQENSFEESLNKKCWLFDTVLLRNQQSIFEKKIWLEILKQMSINNNQITVDTFKTTLNELAYSNDRVCNFLCYIPCQEIQQSFRWQPVRLRIYEYDTCKGVDIPLKIRGKQVQIYKLCNIILENYLHSKILPCDQEIMKVNKNNDNQLIKYQLLYKGAFMKHKMLFMAIYFTNDMFHVCIQSRVSQIIRKLDIIQVELKIPHIRQLLTLNPYEAGRRISLIYRNNFINASFLNL
ncbi:unnamed protein product [Paramecium octaurelia]|uniref:Uncharacterized protein n=1 Tax=Paramecium octaurelia TaxID=43137 RepID=A0A8S1TFM0_PAROT|nr:unnamed protein product [Paramecium octaurelia]